MVRISIATTMAFAISALATPYYPLSGRWISSSSPRAAAGSQNVGKADGSQFITGQCTSDADCASACCAKPAGTCAAKLVAEENGKQGCGFTAAAAGNVTAVVGNNNATVAVGNGTAVAGNGTAAAGNGTAVAGNATAAVSRLRHR